MNEEQEQRRTILYVVNVNGFNVGFQRERERAAIELRLDKLVKLVDFTYKYIYSFRINRSRLALFNYI